MGQRASTGGSSPGSGTGPGSTTASPTSLTHGATNAITSSSSSSSSSSNSSGNQNANGTRGSTTSSRAADRRHHHHHHSSTRRQNSNASNASNDATANSSNLAQMSPRSRLRAEMARRGYGPTSPGSSDLLFRLFQSSNSTNPASSSNSSGGSGFRFFNLGGPSSFANDLDSDLSSDEDESQWNHNLNSLAQSLPFFLGMRDLQCFVCNKMIPADDVEAHIMMCLTKPRLTYNEDVLTDDKGECVICLENLEKGQTIARLPCLCIYHKHCIDNWLRRSQSCPGHPPD